MGPKPPEEKLATEKCMLVTQRHQIAGPEPVLSGDGINIASVLLCYR